MWPQASRGAYLDLSGAWNTRARRLLPIGRWDNFFSKPIHVHCRSPRTAMNHTLFRAFCLTRPPISVGIVPSPVDTLGVPRSFSPPIRLHHSRRRGERPSCSVHTLNGPRASRQRFINSIVLVYGTIQVSHSTFCSVVLFG